MFRFELSDLPIKFKIGLLAALSAAGIAVVLVVYTISETRLDAFLAALHQTFPHDQAITDAERRYASGRRADFWIMGTAILIAIAAMIGLSRYIGHHISEPIDQFTQMIGKFVENDWSSSIDGTARRDEIGALARALVLLRNAGFNNEGDREALESVAAAKERQRAWFGELLEHLPIAVAVYDENERLVFRNSAMNRFHPHPDPDRLIGLTVDEVTRAIAPYAVGQTGERGASEPETFAVNLLQRYRQAERGEFEVSYPSGQIVERHFRWLDRKLLIITAQDITRRRAAETRAIKAEEFLRDIFDHIPVGISVYDENRCLVARNKFMNLFAGEELSQRLIGLPIQKVAELSALARFPDTPDGHRLAAEYLQSECSRFFDDSVTHFTVKRPDDRTFGIRKSITRDNRLIISHSDVTELNRAKRSAESAEFFLRDVVDSLPVGVALVDKSGRVLLRNAQQNKSFPLPATVNPIGMKFVDLAPFRQPLAKLILPSGQIYEGDMRPDRMLALVLDAPPEGVVQILTGEGRSCNMRLKRMPSGDLISVTSDITDLEAARRDAARLERLLKDAIETLPAGFSLYGRDGTLHLFNGRFLDEFRFIADKIRPGMPLSEMYGALWDAAEDDCPPNEAPEAWLSVRGDDAAKAAYVTRRSENFIATKKYADDVARTTGVFRVRILRLPSGDIVRTSTDITDLRKKEVELIELSQSELAKRTEVLREVLDSVPQAIGVFDTARALKFANLSLTDMLYKGRVEGLSLQHILGAVGIGAPQTLDKLDHANSDKTTEVISTENRPLRIRVRPVATGELLLTISDLTAQRLAEAERLDRQERMLRAEKSQALVTLAGTIAHDFNNLLAVILGFSMLASTRLRKQAALVDIPEAESIIAALDNVIASAERGRSVVQSLAALTNGKGRDAEFKVIDLRAGIEDSMRLVRVVIPSSVRMDMSLSPQPCRVVGNVTQLDQVITNLMINAAQAIGDRAGRIVLTLDILDIEGGRADGLTRTDAAARHLGSHVEVAPDGTISIFVGVLSPGRYVCVDIADNGTGIKEDVARKMFAPFFTTKAQSTGTGLGLLSVLEIIEAHGGGIHVRSLPGVGTTFSILLPENGEGTAESLVRSSERATGQISMAAATESGSNMAQDIRTEARIIVVDDDAHLVELATSILQQSDYEVEGFTDPLAAIRRLKKGPHDFDLMLTDQTMPGMTGRDIVDQLRAICPHLPIVICTGFARDVERFGVLPESVKSILNKPYLPDELTESVRRALAAGASL